MSTNHFNYFRVKNFKRFKDLEVKDIGQFNLVLGDNNVGKTSLLEALMWEPVEENIENHFETVVTSRFLKYLIKSYSFKNYGEPLTFLEYFSNLDERENNSIEIGSSKSDESTETYVIKSNNTVTVRYLGELEFGVLSKKSKDFHFLDEKSKKDDQILAKKVDVSEVLNHTIVPLLPFHRSYDEEITEFYLDQIQGNRSLKNKYVSNLRRLFDEIDDLEPSIKGKHKTLLINRSTSNFSVPLGYFGEGTIKMAKILSYLIKFRDKKLMIDEIDTGLYYARMRDYWKVILQSADENNVQLFATTHNRECMEAFRSALDELGEEFTSRSRSITLKQSPKTGDVIAFTNSFEVLDDALEVGNDLR
ncbi:AAA family ATPase [Marinoscillum sp.]|uniref:AAA family ATPase n=1 Tax=Marinoscillum sp. TaxID=2024838 RepID=UPI003BAA81AE